jgi:hypothetical protein
MGTSAARRAPTGRLWRLAKGAATRYFSPAGGAAVTAGEVTARYLAALREGGEQGGAGPLAAFRLTRKVAQELGALASRAASRGWAGALKDLGLEESAPGPPEVLAQGLAGALAGMEGGLEAAVARAALTEVLARSAYRSEGPFGDAEAAPLVRRFLVTALHLRLALDLGEPLEAAAADYQRFQRGMAGLRDSLTAASGAVSDPPRRPQDWQGLPGWTWATRELEALFAGLSMK